MTDKPTPTDAATPECLTCNDHGAVGNILTAEPCPDCTRLNARPAPATQQAGIPGNFITHRAAWREALETAKFVSTGVDRSYWDHELAAFDRSFDRLWTLMQDAPQPSPTAQADSGFDYKTAADFLSGKTVSDEAVRKFVAASRWAHDERAALSATLLAMHGVLTSREAEIALLKKALLEAEAATQPVPDCHHRPPCDECAALAAQRGNK